MSEDRPTQPGSEDPQQPEPRAQPEPPKQSGPPEISIQKFFETELRVARIVAAERVPNADKLLKLRVDLGNEERQLVAGIALAYEPESLIGKRIVVVANLKAARIRGVESQGMLLAADLGGKPTLATFEEDVPPGTPVR
jgi:methionyl-tRNA synthetase